MPPARAAPASDLPKLASPAQRALAGAGIKRLSDLAERTESEIAGLHGIGPNAMKQLRVALAAKGIRFAGAKRSANAAPGPARNAKAAAPSSQRAGKHYRRDGSLESIGRVADGVRVGPWKFYHTDGKTLKAEGKYDAEGSFTGLWKWYAANGKLRQWGRFDQGAQVGLWKRYFGGTDQLCDVGRYVAGKRAGEWKFYDKKGNLRRVQNFR